MAVSRMMRKSAGLTGPSRRSGSNAAISIVALTSWRRTSANGVSVLAHPSSSRNKWRRSSSSIEIQGAISAPPVAMQAGAFSPLLSAPTYSVAYNKTTLRAYEDYSNHHFLEVRNGAAPASLSRQQRRASNCFNERCVADDHHRLSVRNMEGLLQPQSRAEWDVAEHGAVFSGNFEALPVYQVGGKNLLREYLPSGENRLIMGVVESGKLRSFRISIEGGVAANMEVIPGHFVSTEVADPNPRWNVQFPLSLATNSTWNKQALLF